MRKMNPVGKPKISDWTSTPKPIDMFGLLGPSEGQISLQKVSQSETCGLPTLKDCACDIRIEKCQR